MRINLQCPFEHKDKVKALGARWDPAARVWYIKNVEDLTPFMQWIKPQKQPKSRPIFLSGKHTITISNVIGCDCDVLPWDDCEHTEAAAHAAMLEQLGLPA